MRDGLRHAARCPAASHLECPTFQRLLRAAAVKSREKRDERASGKRRPKPTVAAR
jgi:hypothetical protein